jgi:hypothetical protein
VILRLDPTVPLVWRDPTTLQLGVDPPAAVVPDVTPGVERLVAVLAAGVSDSGYPMLADTFGVSPQQAAQLREAVGPVLQAESAETVDGRPQGRVAVLGDTPLARAIARLLDELGLRTSEREHVELVVLVGDRVIAPSEHRGWLQRDIAHLAVVASDAAITVGHVVEPGVTACLHCVDLHRRDADPAWPAIAAQLATLAPPAAHPLRTASAVVHSVRVISERLQNGAAETARERRIAGDGAEVTERVVLPHPECRCAAPLESDWAREAATAAPHPTTTATTSDAHA